MACKIVLVNHKGNWNITHWTFTFNHSTDENTPTLVHKAPRGKQKILQHITTGLTQVFPILLLLYDRYIVTLLACKTYQQKWVLFISEIELHIYYKVLRIWSLSITITRLCDLNYMRNYNIMQILGRVPIYIKLDKWINWIQAGGSCSWIYNYLCNQCLSPLKLWVRTPFMARCTRYNIMW